jgi:hypothetical protein
MKLPVVSMMVSHRVKNTAGCTSQRTEVVALPVLHAGYAGIFDVG